MDEDSETIFMGLVGPETASTEELLAKAAEILGVGTDDIVLVDEVRPGEVCFNAEMPPGYYDEHPDGEEIERDGFTLTWEPGC